MAKKWIARVVQETELEIIVWMDDDERPTEEDVYDAMCYAENFYDSFLYAQKIIEVESNDVDENGDSEIFTFTDEETEDE